MIRSQILAILWPAYWPLLLAGVWLGGISPSCADDGLVTVSRQPQLPAAELEFFETKVRPLLVEHCYACHSARAEKLQAGLRLDSRAALLQGGDSGAAIAPGDVDGSLLIESVRYEAYEMPPKGKLADEDIAILERWVELGAPWPIEVAPQDESNSRSFDLRQRAAEHWAWQPVTDPTPPQVEDETWPLGGVDHFILARLERAGLAPAADVDRPTLLRRLCFDLLGLPPTLEQQTEYLSDEGSTSDATERLVDRLLQSPRFGERWARHWLDLVRYAESRGHEFDDESENAYQYRDYVIRALNADVPYDQFVREHIAGDLLVEPRLHPTLGFNESILGTGFWFLGEWVHSPVDIRKDETDRFDNMIDVMSKTFLGVTVACARCHDHKFDAISTADYYSLCGFLQSSDYRQVRFDTIENERAVAQRLSELDEEYRGRVEGLLHGRLEELGSESESRRGPAGTPCLNNAALVTAYTCATDTCATDTSTIGPEIEWLQDGFVFGARPQRAGEFGVSNEGRLQCVSRSAAASDPFWRGMVSKGQAAQSRSILSPLPRSGRTLRTETFELVAGEVWCRVHGAGHVFACVDSHHLVAGPLHGETLRAIQSDQPWVKLDLSRYVGHRLHLEFTPDDATQLEVSIILQATSPEELTQAKQDVEEYERQEEHWARARLQRVEQILASDTALAAEVNRLVAEWHTQRIALRATLKETSRLAMAMIDGTSEDDHVLVRGSSSNPGKLERRHFLTAISGDRPLHIARGSGRLELAAQINAADNPLPSRVMVNRLWHHLLGRGLVSTTDDFGQLGQRPTHPELLDYLATQFLADGRSIKRMIRRLVLTRTYRMSGASDPRAAEIDPNNDLWHHRPPRRLEGEAIRDSLLAISGAMDPTMFGEPIPIHLTSFMDGRGKPAASGPLDGKARRSIYIAVRRNFLSLFLLSFDTPNPFSTMGRRNSSNVPAQALIMMNDPFVVEQTQHWARRGMSQVSIGSDDESRSDGVRARIEWFYRSGFGRQPSSRETSAAAQFIVEQSERQALELDSLELWQELAHALVNTKEFIFVR
ncbi:MAG: DUF1553 domain-containing protein [Pirellulaceae bacterium]|nr:DUF1553 domain-containing protein [Pirellulaceae bacterium]